MTRRAAGRMGRWTALVAVLALLVQVLASGAGAAAGPNALRQDHCASAARDHGRGAPERSHPGGMPCCVLCTAAVPLGPVPAAPSVLPHGRFAGPAIRTFEPAAPARPRPARLLASPRAPPALV